MLDLACLEIEYNSRTVDQLVSIKKKLYSKMDIQSAMSPQEKLLTRIIAKKFSDMNAAIREKRTHSLLKQ